MVENYKNLKEIKTNLNLYRKNLKKRTFWIAIRNTAIFANSWYST